jgi:hypothetical protein
MVASLARLASGTGIAHSRRRIYVANNGYLNLTSVKDPSLLRITTLRLSVWGIPRGKRYSYGSGGGLEPYVSNKVPRTWMAWRKSLLARICRCMTLASR